MTGLTKVLVRSSLLRRFVRREDGVAALEFGFMGPLIISAILGVMELGRIVFTVAALNHAAEEGTRFAIVNMGTATTETIQEHTRDKLVGVIDGDTSIITATAPPDASGARIVTVRVEMDYRPWFAFMVPNFTMTGESRGFIAFNYD